MTNSNTPYIWCQRYFDLIFTTFVLFIFYVVYTAKYHQYESFC